MPSYTPEVTATFDRGAAATPATRPYSAAPAVQDGEGQIKIIIRTTCDSVVPVRLTPSRGNRLPYSVTSVGTCWPAAGACHGPIWNNICPLRSTEFWPED